MVKNDKKEELKQLFPVNLHTRKSVQSYSQNDKNITISAAKKWRAFICMHLLDSISLKIYSSYCLKYKCQS